MSPYEPLLRNFLRNEIFSDLLLPGNDLENMLVQMQWIALEYAAFRHSIFLRWLLDGADTELSKISYETLRQYLVIITRMTGYETADIYEYLENSFESLLWDWGYFALIIGK
ncbi:flagellar protein FliB [Ruminococcus sp. AF32-2AC]|nr:flagellar protein FliB [Ruminococcus sp. AF32-2AC]